MIFLFIRALNEELLLEIIYIIIGGKNQVYVIVRLSPSCKLHLFCPRTFSLFTRNLLKGSKSRSDFVDSKHHGTPLKERARGNLPIKPGRQPPTLLMNIAVSLVLR